VFFIVSDILDLAQQLQNRSNYKYKIV